MKHQIDIRQLAIDHVQEHFRKDTEAERTMIDLLENFGRLVLHEQARLGRHRLNILMTEYAKKNPEAPASDYGRFEIGPAPADAPKKREHKRGNIINLVHEEEEPLDPCDWTNLTE